MPPGFQHYATLLAEGQENRARLHDRLLVLNEDRGQPQAPLLAGVQQVATDVTTALIPDCGYTIAEN